MAALVHTLEAQAEHRLGVAQTGQAPGIRQLQAQPVDAQQLALPRQSLARAFSTARPVSGGQCGR